ncbi:tyrosyl-DNA phosphodiesterase 2-like [Palaemon carinicauda]|uniref:tyrosyl-DNA phosphodiesterase 2-like n=1 Tax=Palaemon carinicauda TaxID=392227 RepID=UPI0035B6609C
MYKRQRLFEFIEEMAEASSSLCGMPMNLGGPNQLKPVEVDLSKSLDEVKLKPDDTDDHDILVTFESRVQTVHPQNVAPRVPIVFSLISWNIDGIEERNLENRIKGILKVLKREEPDVVYFQEVVPFTLTYLKEHLPQYKILVGSEEGYFIVTLLKIARVEYDSHEVQPFENTIMDRNLLCVQAHLGKVKLNLFNTHLESLKDCSARRKEQMKICFDKMVSSPSSLTTIFGGDLNARDHEVKATQPTSIFDLWEVCGSRISNRWTWNMEENTNKQIPSKPKCRFDRLYMNQSTPAHLVPEEFRLIGKEKVSGMPCFPSDHWGILVRFKVL